MSGIYDYNGNALMQSDVDSFIDNIDVDYRFDTSTQANFTVVRIYKKRIDGSNQYPFVYAPNGTGVATMSTMDLSVDENWPFAINAGVFDPSTQKPLGMIIQNGVIVQNEQAAWGGAYPLTIDSNGDLGYALPTADANDLVSNGIVSAVSGFCPIVVDFDAVNPTFYNWIAHYNQNVQRQIIGQFGNGDYAIVTCEGRDFNHSDGWTIEEAISVCQQLGLKFAYNLDGGGSTETMLWKKPLNLIYEGTTGRKVVSFIVFNGKSTFALPD